LILGARGADADAFPLPKLLGSLDETASRRD
jgi:hypothetical protein